MDDDLQMVRVCVQVTTSSSSDILGYRIRDTLSAFAARFCRLQIYYILPLNAISRGLEAIMCTKRKHAQTDVSSRSR